MTRGPAKATRAPGSASVTSPSMAKLAVTPPDVGAVSTHTYRPPASEKRLWAADTFAICMSDVVPSCMRAPPDTVKPTTGSPASPAFSKHRAIFSPTTDPMEPIMKSPLMTNKAHGRPSIVAWPQTTASFSPLFSRYFSSFEAYPGKFRKSRERRSASHSTKLPASVVISMRRRAVRRMWWPQRGQTSRLVAMSSTSTMRWQLGHFT